MQTSFIQNNVVGWNFDTIFLYFVKCMSGTKCPLIYSPQNTMHSLHSLSLVQDKVKTRNFETIGLLYE